VVRSPDAAEDDTQNGLSVLSLRSLLLFAILFQEVPFSPPRREAWAELLRQSSSQGQIQCSVPAQRKRHYLEETGVSGEGGLA
jgi:hypothetical protein